MTTPLLGHTTKLRSNAFVSDANFTVAIRTILLLLIVASLTPAARGQGRQADYERMESLPQQTANKVFRTNVKPNWLPDGEQFWYRIETGQDTFEFVFVDAQKQTRKALFDHIKVAEQLSQAAGKPVSPGAIPLANLRFQDNGQTLFASFADAEWKINRSDSTLKQTDVFIDLATTRKGLRELKPSVDKGGELIIEFVNDSREPINTIWINRQGRREPYETIPPGKRTRQHTFAGHVWMVTNPAGEILGVYEADPASPKIAIDGTIDSNFRNDRQRSPSRTRNTTSPDGKYRALTRDLNLFVRNLETEEEVQLSENASKDNSFSTRRIYWSPDSRYFVAVQSQPAQEHLVSMIESAPQGQVQPKLHQMNYLKPGDQIRTDLPRMFDARKGQEVPIDAELFQNPWSIQDFRWQPDSSEFSFLFNQRGHQVMRIVGINPTTGETREVVSEVAKTFIDYTRKVFSRHIDSENEIIWMSERDGWNHLYLYDRATGKIKNQITSGKWVVRKVDKVDEEKRQIWFQAGGIVPGQDPYFIHYCRIDFDGSNLVVLTEGNGTHTIQYSPNGQYILDSYSRVDLPAVTNVRRTDDGTQVCELETGDASALLATGWKPTVPFAAKGRDGETDIYGVIYLPTNFDTSKKYPVIEYIYAGPHDSFVPKSFFGAGQTRSMAELGFIVVQIDGMGTSNRSKKFHDVCWKNLGDSGFPDRILWIKAAAKLYPQMDLNRVGIYGGSAGGQSALRALLAHGDFYKAAVSDCGCHDNRMDKIWWNEQWMGWPIGPHYEEQSNVTNAPKLQGKLLLIVGELDRNVDPASTLQVVDALIQADKDFEFLLVPGAGHGIGSRKYGMRRTRDFFVRNLLGVEPRSE